jgi:hypothetical protein
MAGTNDHPDDDYLVDLFLNGQCASFALGVWEALGRPADAGVEVLFDEEGEPNTDDDRCAIHAFWSDSEVQADARGARPPSEMADEYDLGSHHIDGPFAPEEFRRLFCGDDGPFDVDDATIAMAADFVRRHPDLLKEIRR